MCVELTEYCRILPLGTSFKMNNTLAEFNTITQEEFGNNTHVEFGNITVEEFGNNTNKEFINITTLAWNITNEYIGYINSVEAVLIPVIFSVIFLIGIIGNGVLFLYMIRRRRMTSPHNIYVTSLAVGDLLMVTISMPFMSTIYTFETWPYGETICKLSEFAHTLCTSETICMLTVLSIERYMLISGKHSEHRNFMAIITVFVIWVYSFMFAVPDLVSSNLDGPPGFEMCFVYRRSWGESYAKTMTIQKLLFLFVFPVIITVPFYVAIVIKLFRSTSGQTYTGRSTRIKENQKKVRMISLTLTLMTVFVLSWLPRRIFLMWFYFDPSPYTMLWHVVKLVGFCLMYANSAFNPMLFFILDPGIRHFFMSCCRASRKQEYVPVNSENRKDQHTIILTELTHIAEAGSMV